MKTTSCKYCGLPVFFRHVTFYYPTSHVKLKVFNGDGGLHNCRDSVAAAESPLNQFEEPSHDQARIQEETA